LDDLCPRKAANDIDIYQSVLIKDLRLMWDEGIEVFDWFSNKSFICMSCYFSLLMTLLQMRTCWIIVSRVLQHVMCVKETH